MSGKVIVAGGREFNDYELVKETLGALQGITEIVCGKARGADTLGEWYAKNNGIKVAEFKADWDNLGKRAGHVRNAEMADYADTLVAFWDGKSRGTQHMIGDAKRKGLEVIVVRY